MCSQAQFVAFIGRLLGALDAHPLLSAGLILPILALTIFDNLWISGVLHQPGTVRAGALAGLAVVAALGFAYGGAAIPTVPFALVLGFLAIMAVTALLRPDVRG